MIDLHPQLELGGETLRLLPDRAAWLPERRALLLADAHVGKGGHFRALGIAVPRGSSSATLRRLSDLVREYAIEQVYSLGDFLHAAPTSQVLEDLSKWRSRHRGVALTLIPGNHDRSLSALESGGWTVADNVSIGRLSLVHEPLEEPSGATVCGHLHPVARIGVGRADQLTTPTFWLRGQQLILPAFGAFTGGFRIEPATSDRVFVVGPDAVLEIWARESER